MFIYIETGGGLGNVLFQLAATHVLARMHGYKAFAVKKGFSPSVLGPRATYWDTLLEQVYTIDPAPNSLHPPFPCVDFTIHNDHDPIHGYKPIVGMRSNYDMILNGIFQHRRHFWVYCDQLCKIFVRDHLWNHAKSILAKSYNGQDIAFLHVRRGDYKFLSQYHPILPMNYYQRAMKHFPLRTKFLIICEKEDQDRLQEDIRKEMTSKEQARLIWSDAILTHQPDYVQFLIMASCRRGGILANSTFSTWAAFIHCEKRKNNNDDCKTITPVFVCPKSIFAHAPDFGAEIQDPRWIRISNHKNDFVKEIVISNPPSAMTAWKRLKDEKSPFFILLMHIQQNVDDTSEALTLMDRLIPFTQEQEIALQDFTYILGKRPAKSAR